MLIVHVAVIVDKNIQAEKPVIHARLFYRSHCLLHVAHQLDLEAFFLINVILISLSFYDICCM